MSTAMETLGLPCWHSLLLLSDNFGDIPMWQEAFERKYYGTGAPFGRAEFDQLLHSFGAVSSDTPAIAFAEDLVAAYPEAKVVLVERDIDSWYQSYMNTIVEQTFKPWWHISQIVYRIDPFYIRRIGKLHLTGQAAWAGITSRADAELKLKDKYREHYELVRRVTPKERLLEFKLADGWEPLCEFLGKPVPATPFPHLNETKWFEERSALVFKVALVKVIKRCAPWGIFIGVLGAAWIWGKGKI